MMIVIVQKSNGEEVFRFNQDRSDPGDTPTGEQIAQALKQAREPLPQTTERPMSGDELARAPDVAEGARLLRTLADVLPALTVAERTFLKRFSEEFESLAARLAEAEEESRADRP